MPSDRLVPLMPPRRCSHTCPSSTPQGTDGIKRLLTLAQVPVQRRPRRRGQVGFSLLGSPAHGSSPGSAAPSNLHSPSRRRGADLSAGHSPMMALATGGSGSPVARSKSFAFGSPVVTGTGMGTQAHAGQAGVQLVPSSPPLGAAAAAAAAAAGSAGDRSPSFMPRSVSMGPTGAAAAARHGGAGAGRSGSGLGDIPCAFIQPTSGEWPCPEVEGECADGQPFGHCHVMSHEEIEAVAARARQRREVRVTAEVGGVAHVITMCSLGHQSAHVAPPSPSASASASQRPASAAGWLQGADPGSPGGASSTRSPIRRPGTACAALRTVSTSAVFGGHSRTPQAAAVAAGVGAAHVAAVRRSASPGPAGGAASSTGASATGSTGVASPVASVGRGHSIRRASGSEAAATAAAATAEGGLAATGATAVVSCASSAALSAPYGHYGGYAGGGNGGTGPLWRSNGLLGEVLHSLDRAGLADLDRGLQEQAALQAAAAALCESPTAPTAAEASAAAALASVVTSSSSLGSPLMLAAQRGQQARQLRKSTSSRAGPAAVGGGGGGGGGGAYGGSGGPSGSGAVPARPHTSMAVYGPGSGASAARQAYHSTPVAPEAPGGCVFRGGESDADEEDLGPGDSVVAGWWGEVVSTAHLALQSGASQAAQGGPHASSPAGSSGNGASSGPGQRVSRTAPNFMSGTASANALYLDVSGGSCRQGATLGRAWGVGSRDSGMDCRAPLLMHAAQAQP